MIRNALRQGTLQTTQPSISGSKVMEYVGLLRRGQIPPPIEVDNGILVNGNHRYAAGLIFGTPPPQIQVNFLGAGYKGAMPVSELHIDL